MRKEKSRIRAQRLRNWPERYGVSKDRILKEALNGNEEYLKGMKKESGSGSEIQRLD